MNSCVTPKALSLVIVTAIIAPLIVSKPDLSSAFQGDQISIAIRSLWSTDNDERQHAKGTLSMAGAVAIPQLTVLLEDILKNAYPRFAIGQEKEGLEALERSRTSDSMQERERSFWRAVELSINRRLRTDIGDILQVSRDGEATSALIMLMEVGDIDKMSSARMSDPMYALIRIGSPAVPDLLRELQSVDSITWNRARLAYFGCGFGCGFANPPPMTDVALQKKRQLLPEYRDADRQRIIEAVKYEIRSRTLRVLGRIGDVRALPVLKALLLSGDQRVRDSVQYAIDRIEDKQPNRR